MQLTIASALRALRSISSRINPSVAVTIAAASLASTCVAPRTANSRCGGVEPFASKLMLGIFPERGEGRKTGWVGGESNRGVTYGRIAPISNTATGNRLAALAARQHGVAARSQLRQ